MKITKIRGTPLLCKFKQPYHWAQGVTLGAPVILIEVETDERHHRHRRVGREPDDRTGARHHPGRDSAFHRPVDL